jgi:muramoyltetrapeptide carboxypeptidase LdcA involved in peptidoglycan recycling
VSTLTPLRRPPRLAPGARVAVVAPSGPIPEERLAAGLDVLRGWGLDPVAAPHVLDRHGELGYLAGADADRAADLQRAWCDPAVDAVICARGGLLCLEDVGEETYRLDRYLTQLLRAGMLDGVAGLLLGSWAECDPYDTVRTLLVDRLGGLGVPVDEQFGFGHCDDALTLPFGVAAELDADAGTLTLDEPALS